MRYHFSENDGWMAGFGLIALGITMYGTIGYRLAYGTQLIPKSWSERTIDLLVLTFTSCIYVSATIAYIKYYKNAHIGIPVAILIMAVIIKICINFLSRQIFGENFDD